MVGQYGAYYKLNIQTLQHPNEVLSAFVKPGSALEFVKANDEILANVDDVAKEFNGRLYRNFKIAKPEEAVVLSMQELQREVQRLNDKVFGKGAPPAAEINNIDDEIDPNDLPF